MSEERTIIISDDPFAIIEDAVIEENEICLKHKKKEPGEILVFSCFIGNHYEIRCKMKNIHLKHFLKRLYSYTKTDKMYIIRLRGIRKRRK